MVDLFERGPLAAWVVGLALPAAGLYLLWRVVRRHPKAVYVAWGLLAVRLGILAVHLDWITRYLAYRRMH